MRKKLDRKVIIALAVVFSIILYAAGLISGLSFSKFIEQNLQAKAEQDMEFLVEYVRDLDSDLQSAQIQESFIRSLDQNNSCSFADVYFSEVQKNLNFFWDILPSRLEQYEKDRQLSPQYLDLKQRYTKLALRAWITANENYQKCDTKIVPALYFYSTSCDDCVMQGEILDNVKDTLAEENRSLVVFTVDLEYEEPSLQLVTKYYNVTQVPAVIVNEQVLQGTLFSRQEIMEALDVRR